jgi:hypothetical protein
MNLRILIAALVGGVVLFVWGAVAHMALNLGSGAFAALPAEAALASDLRQQGPAPGMYYFPWVDPGADEATQQAWIERWKQGPSGILVLAPQGEDPMSPQTLVIELASDVLAALLLALLLSASRCGSLPSRLWFGATAGLLGGVMIDVSYWNWYRFSSGFAAGSMIEQTVGGALCALAMAPLLRRAG